MPADEEHPDSYVRITRLGRWMHEVNIVTDHVVQMPSGSMDPAAPASPTRFVSMAYESPWLAFGRRHAERLGARKLRGHLRREAWRWDG